MSLLAQKAEFGGAIKPPSEGYGSNAVTSAAGTFDSLEGMISTGLAVLTVIAGIFFIVFFFMAAIKWVTAGGDGSKVGKARDEMVQGIVGLIVIVAAYGVIGVIGSIIGINILDPRAVLMPLIPPATP